jgi:hypothetical protein
MRVRLALLVLAAAAAATAAPQAPAAPAPYVLQGDRNAGGVVIARSLPAAAVARFGTPSTRRAEGVSCLLYWPQIGTAIRFLAFEGNPCRDGVAVVVTITSRARWRTLIGLRVGDDLTRLRALYPTARRQLGGFGPERGFWLVPRRACAETGGHAYPGLLARVRDGRVSALVASTRACE